MHVSRFLISAATAAALVTILPQAPPQAAPQGTKTVVLQCTNGWLATAGGQYGGVFFQLSCRNGKSQARLSDTDGTAYTIRTGVESSSIGADCFHSGEAETVSETCADVRISIR